jgi:LPXTG-motif cell wall-anchored protein
MLLSLIPPIEAADTVTSTDTVISGNYTMTGNFTVSHGTTMTIKPGSVIDMGPYWLKVEGALYANDSTIMSTELSPGSGGHNAGVWDSLTISSGAYASLNNVTISNAKSCLIVEGNVDATFLELRHCLIGIEADGILNVYGLIGEDIDHDGVRVTNYAQITGANFANMSGGIASSGTLHLNTSQYVDVGTSITLTNGTADINDVNYVSGVSTGISISSGAIGTLTGMTGEAVNAISAIDSTGFVISDVNMTGSRLLNSWDAGDLTLQDAIFEGTSAETIVDVRTSGHLTLNNITITGSFSSNQNSYDAPWIGMSFSGSGDYTISNASVDSTNTALTSTGTGTLSISNSSFTSSDKGLIITGISSTTMDFVSVNIDQGGTKGIELQQGLHDLYHIDVNMPFNQWETGSIGLETWWSEITADTGLVEVNGFATSIEAHSSLISADYLRLHDSSEVGLNLYNSELKINEELQTRVSDYGIKQHQSSNVVVKKWDSSYHDTGASICGNIESQSPCSLTVWDWSTTNNLNSDATGAGELYYPANSAYSTSVDTEHKMWETTIYFEDLSENSVDADWQINGFSGTSVAGMATVMVTEGADTIEASVNGVGTIMSVTGFDGASYTIEIPLLPDGDWIIGNGDEIVLHPRNDGTPHLAGGNITINAGGSLTLHSTLQLPFANSSITISGGDLYSQGSTIIGDVIILGDGFLPGPDGFAEAYDLRTVVEGDISWSSCWTDTIASSYYLDVIGDVSIESSCDVELYSSSIEGEVTVGVGSNLEMINTLTIFVLDKGISVQGASITIDGQTITTDASGSVSKHVTARHTDSTGTTWAGLKTVRMQSGSLVDLMAWDTNQSLTYTFTASTIDGGEISDWLILEKIWSPYHLSEDLTIPQGQTMTIHDGVELRIAEGVQIIVEGAFDSGASTLLGTGGGSRWGGLLIGGNTQTSATLLGTHLVEGSPLVKMAGPATVVLTDTLLARSSGAESLVDIQYSASGDFTLTNSQLSDASSKCIMAQGPTTIKLIGLSISNCNDESIWARGPDLTISSIITENPVDVTGSSGEISDLSTTDLIVSSTDGLEINNLMLSGSLLGADVRDLIVNGAIINSAPGVDLDATSGVINDLEIDCGGNGVGLVSHHGRASSQLEIKDSIIMNCTKGVDLHSDGESAPIVIENTIIEAQTVLATDGYSFEINGGNLNGSIESSNATGDLVDVISEVGTVTGGEITYWKTHILDVRLEGNSQNTNLELNIESLEWSISTFGNSIELEIPYLVVNHGGTVTSSTMLVNSEFEGLPSYSTEVSVGPDADQTIQINLISNEGPSVEITHPDDGQRFMETLPIEVKALVSDDLDLVSDLIISWTVTFSQTTVMQLSGVSNNITDLQAGIYVLTLSVTDTQGVTSTDSLSFEITLLDSDNDWIGTCNSETWFDPENSVRCGPDIYDEDDDNDAIYDTRDPWPTDPCASMDTDGDGQPDEIQCPIGTTTWLVEDPDDDGDGIPDILESNNEETSSSSNSTLVLIVIFILISAGAFIVLRKRKEV